MIYYTMTYSAILYYDTIEYTNLLVIAHNSNSLMGSFATIYHANTCWCCNLLLILPACRHVTLS